MDVLRTHAHAYEKKSNYLGNFNNGYDQGRGVSEAAPLITMPVLFRKLQITCMCVGGGEGGSINPTKLEANKMCSSCHSIPDALVL